MSGVEEWCVFQKLTNGKVLTHAQVENPSASLICACSDFGLFAFAKTNLVTFTTWAALVDWLKGTSEGLREEFKVPIEGGKDVTHVVFSPRGALAVVAAQEEVRFLRVKRILDGAPTKQAASFTFSAPVHYIEISPENKVLFLLKSGSLSLISKLQRSDLNYENVQACCFSLSGKEIVIAQAGKFSMIAVRDLQMMGTWETGLESQVIGLKQLRPESWAFMGIDSDLNTECYVIKHSFFEGQDFHSSTCYYEGTSGGLNPVKLPPEYNLKQLHCAYITPVPERDLFLFSSTVSASVECVYRKEDTYERFDPETSKIKAPLGYTTMATKRISILCRGMVLTRSRWDSAPRFQIHYIDDDYDMPSPPLVLAVGMTGELVPYLFLDLRNDFLQRDTLTIAAPLTDVPDYNPATDAADPGLSRLALDGNRPPAKPEEEKKRDPIIIPKPLEVKPGVVPSAEAGRGSEEVKRPPPPSGLGGLEKQEEDLYHYFLTKLAEMTASVSNLRSLVTAKSVSDQANTTLGLRIREVRRTVERGKMDLEELNGPLARLQQDATSNKLEYETLEKMRKDGFVQNMANFLPLKMKKRLKTMEKRVALLQEYEFAFKTLAERQMSRAEVLIGPRPSLGSRLTSGPRALKRYSGPVKAVPPIQISKEAAKSVLISTTETIHFKLSALESSLKSYQKRKLSTSQEKRFDFSDVETIELDERDLEQDEDQTYTPEKAEKDFRDAVGRMSRGKDSGEKPQTPSKLMSLNRASYEKESIRLGGRQKSIGRLDLKLEPVSTQPLSGKLQQFDRIVQGISSQKQGGISGSGDDGNPQGNGTQGMAGLLINPVQTQERIPVVGQSEPAPKEAAPRQEDLAKSLFPATSPASAIETPLIPKAENPAKIDFSPVPVTTNPAFPTNPVVFPISAPNTNDQKPMFSGFSMASQAPNSASGFGVQSGFSKPSIPTGFGGFSVGQQGGGFKGMMSQGASGGFAGLQSNAVPPTVPQSTFNQGANSALFKPRK